MYPGQGAGGEDRAETGRGNWNWEVQRERRREMRESGKGKDKDKEEGKWDDGRRKEGGEKPHRGRRRGQARRSAVARVGYEIMG
jgi:hypothetical protein